MGRPWGIAGIQMQPSPWQPEETLRRMVDVVEQTVERLPWVSMICFPELCGPAVCGYVAPPRHDYAASVAEPIPGPTSERLRRVAATVRRWLVPGTLYERAGDDVYNTALVISPAGEIVTRYRKMFPWTPLERTTPGDSFCVFDVPNIGRFGLCICYDMWFPEVCRTLTWMGAEVILHPSLTVTGDRPQELVLAQANAIFNQSYFIDVNGVGTYGGGRSIFVGPEGRVLQEAGEREAVLAELLDLDAVTRTRRHGTLGLSTILRDLRRRSVDFPRPVDRRSPLDDALDELDGPSQAGEGEARG